MKGDVAGILLTILLSSILYSTFNIPQVKAAGTIYIRADGSLVGTASIKTADNITYLFTADIKGSIIVERNNILIDGNGYTLLGSNEYNSNGMDLSGREHVTIRNTQIKSCYYGILLNYSSSNSFSRNRITNNYYSINLYSSSNNTISGNDITNNSHGIRLYDSSDYNSFSGNSITNNEQGFLIFSSSSNIINGNNITGNYNGIELEPRSDYNSISGNNITNNEQGILIYSSSSNIINGNNITANKWGGIQLSYSSSSNNISENHITNNYYGIVLDYSPIYNIMSGNELMNNIIGISLFSSSDNSICHSNFINNTQQISAAQTGYVNIWDNGVEGNYWSDYNGTDFDGDGVGDVPYIIDGSNKDNYPLMSPYMPAGDVNHDGIVDILDVVKIAIAYNSDSESPRWNPHCDLNEDGKINISDLAAIHFGELWTAP